MARAPISTPLLLLLGIVTLLAFVPGVPGWPLIANYDAIPHVKVRLGEDIRFRSADNRPIVDAQDLVMDHQGGLFLADHGSQRVLRFPAADLRNGAVFVSQAQDRELQWPFGLALDPNRNLHVLDHATGIVHVYADDGALVRRMPLGSHGARAIAIDQSGAIYIGDTGARILRKYRSGGEVDTSWGPNGNGRVEIDSVAGLVTIGDLVYAATEQTVVLLDRTGTVMKQEKLVGYTGRLARGPGDTILGLVMK
jgi:hypothetical protein